MPRPSKVVQSRDTRPRKILGRILVATAKSPEPNLSTLISPYPARISPPVKTLIAKMDTNKVPVKLVKVTRVLGRTGMLSRSSKGAQLTAQALVVVSPRSVSNSSRTRPEASSGTSRAQVCSCCEKGAAKI